jgi:hypothetical protein
VGFFVLWFLPQLELRTQSGIQAAAAEAPGAVPPADERTQEEQVAHAAGAGAPTSTAPPAGKPRD